MSRTPRLPSAVEGAASSFETMLALAPGLRPRYLEFRQALWRSEVVAPQTKELVRVRSANKIDCFL
jgi:hypothetical protein